MEQRNVKVIRRYKAGYEVCEAEWSVDGEHDWTVIRFARTPNGDYIGNPRDAHRLCVQRGIRPEKRGPDANVCSIGFSERQQKWFGWSHRAICGFQIGDTVKEGDCTASSGWTPEYLAEHPEADLALPVGFTAKTLDDCKRMAIAFADSVS